MKKEKIPLLSFIFTGRNDDYGHRFLYRMQRFLDSLQQQVKKDTFVEIIIVEWDPPKNKKRLHEALNIKKSDNIKFRFIEVPSGIHKKIKNPEKFRLLEFHAKNVGLRRARGKFLILTNPDIIFNKSFIKFIEKVPHSSKKIYVSKRYNLLRDIPEKMNLSELECFCKENSYGLFGIPFNYPKHPKFIDLLKEFYLFSKNYSRLFIIKMFDRKRYDKEKILSGLYPGDFVMTSKSNWERKRGYPELNLKGFADTIFLRDSLKEGFMIKELPSRCRMYHQFHPPGEGSKIDIGAIMHKNDSNWGLKKEELKEKVL